MDCFTAQRKWCHKRHNHTKKYSNECPRLKLTSAALQTPYIEPVNCWLDMDSCLQNRKTFGHHNLDSIWTLLLFNIKTRTYLMPLCNFTSFVAFWETEAGADDSFWWLWIAGWHRVTRRWSACCCMQQPFPLCLDRFGDRPVFSHFIVKWYLQGVKRKWLVACVSPAGPATDFPGIGVRPLWAPGAFIFVAVVSFIACSDLRQKCVWAEWLSVNLCCLLTCCYSLTETQVNGKNIVTTSTCITEEVAGYL